MDLVNLKIVMILAVGFSLASLLGYLSNLLKLSPLLGYLIAGYLIGPFSPGYIADVHLSEQLAEIGVVLMMFGVGLHFKWQDLVKTSRISIPGAIGQTLIAGIFGFFLAYNVGWGFEGSIIFGLSIGIASTVVLVRVLSDHHLLHTTEGHISVGWLIVEDIIAVLLLLLVPSLASSAGGEGFSILNITTTFSVILIKFIVLAVVVLKYGKKLVSYLLTQVLHTKSHELFTLTILSITFIIAVGSSLLLGTSIILGAFLAGMVMGQTEIHHKIASNTISLRDTFIVIFFLSIGMLFNPMAVVNNFLIFLGVLAIILIVKPLTAFIIALVLKYPMKVAVTIGLVLAQIGEFSFILAEEASKYHILPDDGYDIIVACSFVSISINPLIFRLFCQKSKKIPENDHL